MKIHPAAFKLLPLCDTESTRFALGGVLFRSKPGSTICEAVATDGKACAVLSWHAEQPRETAVNAIVPARVLKAASERLRDMMKRDAATFAELSLDGQQCRISVNSDPLIGSAVFSAEIPEGSYPNIDGLQVWQYPKATREASTVTLDPKYIIALSRLAESIAPNNAVQITVCENDSVQLWVKSGTIALRAVVMEITRDETLLPPIGQNETNDALFAAHREEITRLKSAHRAEIESVRGALANLSPDEIGLRLEEVAKEIRGFANTVAVA